MLFKRFYGQVFQLGGGVPADYLATIAQERVFTIRIAEMVTIHKVSRSVEEPHDIVEIIIVSGTQSWRVCSKEEYELAAGHLSTEGIELPDFDGLLLTS